MQEILFRGKRADNGEWVEGYYCRAFRWAGDKEPVTAIQENDSFMFRAIDPSTVGQYTGLTDKNGKKIFEGDIVDVEYDINYVGVAVQRIGKFKVVFSDGCFMKEKISGSGLFHFIQSDVTTILGNIYDNSELLDGDEE